MNQKDYGQNTPNQGYNGYSQNNNESSNDYSNSSYGTVSNGPYSGMNSREIYTNTLGIVSLILGVMSMIFFVFNIINIIVGILAIVFGLSLLNRDKLFHKKSGLAVAGFVTGILGIVFTIVFYVLLFTGVFRSGLVDLVRDQNEKTVIEEYNDDDGDSFDLDDFLNQVDQI
jgi:membrane-bound ClpP family serine protease